MSSRADRTVARVAEEGLDALLVTNLPNLRWLTGFTGSNGAALIGPEVRRFFTDFRYVEHAAAQVRDFECVQVGRDLLGEVAAGITGRVGFEDQWLSVRAHARVRDGAPGAELAGASGLVERLREVKEPAELELMRAAAAIADEAYGELAEGGIGDRSERRIALDLEVRLRELGADGLSFPPIVASGAHGASPHAEPRDVPVERGSLMVVDMGCVVDGYCSDCTRTFATGPLSDESQAVYDVVAGAQLEALAAVRAGAGCRLVDGVARDVISEAGYGDCFGHGLGHGVGLEVHEGPRLAQTSEGLLATGNTVTVEPGVYLPGRLGVRIEDLVAVTESGCEILTGFTKSLVTLA